MASRERYIDPIGKELDAEYRFIQSTTRQSRRVQIEKGDSWLIRFLPVQFGQRQLWYARTAKHWLHKKPISCPRLTAESYGGKPDAYCPVCDAVEELNQHSDEKVRDVAWSARATPQWLTYCIVISKKLNRQVIDMPEDELLMPYEFSLYKGTWEELVNFYRNNSRRDNPFSVFDLLNGCDFWATKSPSKPVRLDKQDPAPILDELTDPPEDDPRVLKMLKECHEPRVTMPTDDQMLQFAEKLHEACFETEGNRGRSAGRRDGTQASDDNIDETEGATSTSGRRAAPTEKQEVDPEQEADPEPPARTAPAGRRSVTRAVDPEPEPEAEAPAAEQEEAPAAPPPPARGRAAAAAPARQAPAAPPARTASRSAKASTGKIDEDDNDPLPEDDKDPVDPAKDPVEGTGTPARGRTAPAATPPPAVGRSGGTPVQQNALARVSAVVNSARTARR